MSFPRSTLLLLSLVTFVLVAVPTARGAARVNALSVQYNTEVQERLPRQVALPSPPALHPRATLWRAVRALESDDADTALALSRQLGGMDHSVASGIMARAMELRGDYSAAVDVWKQTGDAGALLRVAEAATEAGQLDAALNALYAAWELDPAGRSTGRLASFLWKEKEDPAAAESIMRQTIPAYPGFPYREDWLYLLAAIVEAQEQWRDSIAIYQQIIAENPEEGGAYLGIAWAYRQMGEAGPAISAIERALSLSPKKVHVLRRAGQIYEFAGQTDKALAFYQQVLASHPRDQIALEGLGRLTSD